MFKGLFQIKLKPDLKQESHLTEKIEHQAQFSSTQN